MNEKWANRFQCNEFTNKKVTIDKVKEICDIINYIPEAPAGLGENRVVWFLLDKKRGSHRKVVEYLVENIHTAFQEKDLRNPKNLRIHFAQLLQAPYVLHGAIVRMSKRYPLRSAYTSDVNIIKNRNKSRTFGALTVADLKQYVSLSVHAGSILTQIVNSGLNCCFVGIVKGRFLNFPKLISYEEEREFTKLISSVFPTIYDNPLPSLQSPNPGLNVGIHTIDTLCPGLSIGFGYGIKHDDPDKILTDGKYLWPAYKDRKKYPNLFTDFRDYDV